MCPAGSERVKRYMQYKHVDLKKQKDIGEALERIEEILTITEASAMTLTLTYIVTLSNVQKVLDVAHCLLKNLLTKEVDLIIDTHTQNLE